MPRRNQGPRLRWLNKRECFYITWTESGRSRERSTGTTDSREAEIKFAEFLRDRQRSAGPRDANQILITDILSDYATERGPKVVASERIAYALIPLIDFWCITNIYIHDDLPITEREIPKGILLSAIIMTMILLSLKVNIVVGY